MFVLLSFLPSLHSSLPFIPPFPSFHHSPHFSVPPSFLPSLIPPFQALSFIPHPSSLLPLASYTLSFPHHTLTQHPRNSHLLTPSLILLTHTSSFPPSHFTLMLCTLFTMIYYIIVTNFSFLFFVCSYCSVFLLGFVLVFVCLFLFCLIGNCFVFLSLPFIL